MSGGAPLRVLLAAAGIVVLCVSSYWSLRRAHADMLAHSGDPADLDRAILLDPANASYMVRKAAVGAIEGRAVDEIHRQALALNPYDVKLRIRLGLEAELRADFPLAESLLVHAVSVSRQFEPRWALVNFWFRRGDVERFRYWTRRALELSYGDPSGVFLLCHRIGLSPNEILDDLPPDRQLLLGRYLEFLLSRGALSEAEPVAQRLLTTVAAVDPAPLLRYCTLLIRSGRHAACVRIWTALGERGLIPYRPNTSGYPLLTNGDFAHKPMEEGFDWILPPVHGVSASRSGEPTALVLRFSGRQPERCQVLYQFVPVAPDTAYRLLFRYRLFGNAKPASLRWRVFAGDDVELPVSQQPAESAGWREGAIEFRTPNKTDVVRLALYCERLPGTTRAEGTLHLRDLHLEPK